MNRKPNEKPTRLKTAITIAAAGLFGATLGTVVTIDQTQNATAQSNQVASNLQTTSQTSSAAGPVFPTPYPGQTAPLATPTPSPFNSYQYQSPYTNTRRTYVVPFPNARSRGS